MRSFFIIIFLICLASAKAEILTHSKVKKICEEACINADEKNKCMSFGYRDCDLVSSIAKKESGFNIYSFNPEVTGSYGLMQIQCSTAKSLGLKGSCDKLFNPKVNVKIGILFLIQLEKKLKDFNIDDMLSAYNAGLRVVKNNGEKRYEPIRCKNFNKFFWHYSKEVVCYSGEYINQEYVWQIKRYYNDIKREKK